MNHNCNGNSFYTHVCSINVPSLDETMSRWSQTIKSKFVELVCDVCEVLFVFQALDNLWNPNKFVILIWCTTIGPCSLTSNRWNDISGSTSDWRMVNSYSCVRCKICEMLFDLISATSLSSQTESIFVPAGPFGLRLLSYIVCRAQYESTFVLFRV